MIAQAEKEENREEIGNLMAELKVLHDELAGIGDD